MLALCDFFFNSNNGTDGDGEALVNRSSPWLKHKQQKHPVPGLNGLVRACKQPPPSSGSTERILPLADQQAQKDEKLHQAFTACKEALRG